MSAWRVFAHAESHYAMLFSTIHTVTDCSKTCTCTSLTWPDLFFFCLGGGEKGLATRDYTCTCLATYWATTSNMSQP